MHTFSAHASTASAGSLVVAVFGGASFRFRFVPSIVAFFSGFTGSILRVASVKDTFSIEAVIAIFLVSCKNCI